VLQPENNPVDRLPYPKSWTAAWITSWIRSDIRPKKCPATVARRFEVIPVCGSTVTMTSDRMKKVRHRPLEFWTAGGISYGLCSTFDEVLDEWI
jgi:hypothetical protein